MSLNRWLGAASSLAGLAFLFIVIPMQSETVGYGALQPRTFPSIGAALMILFGIAQTLRPTGETEFDSPRAIRAAATIAVSVAALIAMEFAGYLVAAPLLVGALMMYVGERRPGWLAAGIVLCPALLWVMFEILLRRPLP
ncbi:MAG: tripartite tricarboxylate transporter TctB family protein [Beijerinckiaceae bacterium]